MPRFFQIIAAFLREPGAKLKGFRTIMVNFCLAIMPILEMSEMTDILPQHYEAPYAIFIALTNLYLRSVTTTPVCRAE